MVKHYLHFRSSRQHVLDEVHHADLVTLRRSLRLRGLRKFHQRLSQLRLLTCCGAIHPQQVLNGHVRWGRKSAMKLRFDAQTRDLFDRKFHHRWRNQGGRPLVILRGDFLLEGLDSSFEVHTFGEVDQQGSNGRIADAAHGSVFAMFPDEGLAVAAESAVLPLQVLERLHKFCVLSAPINGVAFDQVEDRLDRFGSKFFQCSAQYQEVSVLLPGDAGVGCYE